ncbi:S1C family serine protease [Anaeromyxobacter oryzisoli]|uniref:S1C family serine protease n=1 Tax=Anaeromyxobacter oryzisoli TaxID=2925408 RepID=UPI001F5983CD|nr:trypsin-like peptidase domain-containing protein [Anaeromyxobacter sp. SG63]
MPLTTLAPLLAALAISAPASARPAGKAPPAAPIAGASVLRALDGALESVVAKVSPAVVQVAVSGYGPAEEEGDGASVIVRQHAVGSGVVVDPSGYVVTNAHVVEGAQRVRVLLPQLEDGPRLHRVKRIHDARVVGIEPDLDLALLKIEAAGLPTLALGTREPRPGQLVFAVGSPQGLASTVTMGVISSVSRQPMPDRPMLYIQTDAPINPGNSGGPLVDTEGNVVGINTLILSQSGGSEGLGFAIPASVVQFVYENLRRYGHVHRTLVGVTAQEITPGLASALALPQDWGIVVSDVAPEGPGADAGLKAGDVLLSVDGRAVETMPALSSALYVHPAGKPVAMTVRRGRATVALSVKGRDPPPAEERLAALAEVGKSTVSRLGIVGVALDERSRPLFPGLREPDGVVVVARTLDAQLEVPLLPGDVIHAVNLTPVRTMQELRTAIGALPNRGAAALRVERRGQLSWVEVELEP